MVDTVALVATHMRTPTCIEIVVKDADITRPSQKLVEIDPPSTANYNTRTTEYLGLPGTVQGPLKDHILLFDTPPAAHLDRDDAVDMANYVALDTGTVNVVAITYGGNRLLDIGRYAISSTLFVDAQQREHYIRFQLDGPLPVGTDVTLTPPSSAFPTVNWTFNDKTTHCPSLHVNHAGHGSADIAMRGSASFWNCGFGDEGITDLINDHGITGFYVLDPDSLDTFGPFPVILRKAADDNEDGGGVWGNVTLLDSGTNLMRCVSTTRHFPITAISKANPMVITAPGHDVEIGEETAALYCVGMNQVNFFGTGNYWVVTAVDGDDITFGAVNSTSWGTYTGGGSLYGKTLKNGAGTHTYTLDYSGFNFQHLKDYKLYVPGLGVSLPFRIDDACYKRAADIAIGGLENIRNAYAKTGNKGYTAPLNLKPGVNVTCYRSSLPLFLSSEGGGPVPFAEGGSVVWIYGDPITEVWGEYQNAGDWDVRGDQMVIGSRILDLHDLVPAANFEAGFGVPDALDCGVDATFWAGTRSLPNILQEVIWQFDAWRRMRAVTGEVGGGYEFNGGPDGVSWLTRLTMFVYKPDPQHTFRFAAFAAHLGRIIKEYGLTTLGDALIAMAIESYDRALAILADMDTYYVDTIAAGTTDGLFETVSWETRKTNFVNAVNSANDKLAAAARIYRATLDTDYRAVVEAAQGWPFSNPNAVIAGWDYIMTVDAGKNATHVTYYTNIFLINVATNEGINDAAEYAFPYTKLNGGVALFGGAIRPGRGGEGCIRAYVLTEDTQYLEPLFDHANWVLGNNPLNMSFVRSLGAKSVVGIYNKDTIELGQLSPDGLIPFGYMIWVYWPYSWLFGTGAGSEWTALPSYRNQMADDAQNAKYRMPEPCIWQLPIYEYLIEHPSIIPMMEHGAEHYSIFFRLFVFLWAHARPGITNTATEIGSRIRLRMNAV